MGKRRNLSSYTSAPSKKKGKATPFVKTPVDEIESAFRPGLFEKDVLKEYNTQYRDSSPCVSFSCFCSPFR